MNSIMEFEYKFDTVENYFGIDDVHQELLNNRSADGWIMVNAILIEVGGRPCMRFYWKREIIKVSMKVQCMSCEEKIEYSSGVFTCSECSK